MKIYDFIEWCWWILKFKNKYVQQDICFKKIFEGYLKKISRKEIKKLYFKVNFKKY